MDPEISQLKELVRQNIALTQETNKLLHKMRRGVWWGRIFTLLVWIIMLVAPLAVYYYFFQPILSNVESTFHLNQQQSSSYQNIQKEIEQYLTLIASSTPSH